MDPTTFDDVAETRAAAADDTLRGWQPPSAELWDALPHMAWVVGPDGRPGPVNRPWLDWTGLSAPAGWAAAVHPEDRPRAEQLWQACRAGGRTAETELRYTQADGTPRWVLCRLAPLGGGGWLGTATDIDHRRRADEALARTEEQLRQAQKMEAVGRLAGGVAHDFNNLLTVINGFTALLLDRLPAGDPARGFAEEVSGAGERAAALTGQLMAFARKQPRQPVALDLNRVVRDLDGLLRRLAGEDLTLEHDLAAGLWPVTADPSQMEQVLLNLVVNARDATPAGGSVRVRTANAAVDAAAAAARPALVPGAYVVLTVTDTGCGMDEATRARVFEPFFTTKGPGQGTGLGLATVYGVVKQSAGFVYADSEPGRGTTFAVYLPASPGAATESGVRTAAPSAWPRGTETVLLVDDDEGVRGLARRVLQYCGYTTIDAETPHQAARLFDRHGKAIALLVTDVVMPGMSGPQLAGALAKRRPGLPVLYLSGHSDEDVARRGPAGALLRKPFAPAELAAAVRARLDAARG